MSETSDGRGRRVTFRVVAAVATLLTLLLTFGTTVPLLTQDLSDGERLAALAHAPWLGLGWCAAFAALVWRPRRWPAAMQQAVAMLAGLYLGGIVIARENDPVFYVGFGLVVGLLVWLHPSRHAVLRAGPRGVSPILLPLSLVAAGPLLVYAVDMMELAHEVGDGGAFYPGVAATACAVPLLGLVAALGAPGFRLPGLAAAVLLASLGVASLLYADDRGALPTWAASLALAGAVAYAAGVEWHARVGRRSITAPVAPV